MKILESPLALSEQVPHIALAAGFFDGVHLGHQKILAETFSFAHQHGSQAWALTFDPHPLAVIDPTRTPCLLTRLDLRLELLARSGLDGCLLMPFTPELAALSAEAFVTTVFGSWLQPGRTCAVVSGKNWRFGHNRSGSLDSIQAFSHGSISIVHAPMVMHNGERVSSSRIRSAILSGNLPDATAMLGHPHLIRERTVVGRGIGTQMGLATANMPTTAEVLPPVGVYEVAASLRSDASGRWMKGVANLGFRPTFPDARPEKPELEVHILDFAGDLHGCELDVKFLRRLRDEVQFETREALVKQIQLDIAAVRGEEPSSFET